VKKPRRLLVVDTMNLVLRAYYAPIHVPVALEGGGPSFREELFPEY